MSSGSIEGRPVRLCEEVHLNLAYRWFCKLGLDDKVPDHSSFTKNRHGRFRESEAFRYLFEEVVQRCMTEGLVRGEGFAIDASIISADANRTRGVPNEVTVDWRDPAQISTGRHCVTSECGILYFYHTRLSGHVRHRAPWHQFCGPNRWGGLRK